MKGEFYTSYGTAYSKSPTSWLLSIKPYIKNITFLLTFALFTTALFAQTPSAVNDQASTGKNMPVTIKVLDNDANYVTGNTAIQTAPSHGTTEVNSSTGIINYWPETDYTGTDQFTYSIQDGAGNTATASVNITITDEVCSTPINGNDFSWNNPSTTDPVVTQQMTQPATSNGFVFDIYELDNSFNMKINGTDLASAEIQFQSEGTGGINVRYQDGEGIEDNGRAIWSLEGDAENPLVRVKILADGSIKLYVAKASGGPLYPVELIDGAHFNVIDWNADASNEIIVTQEVNGPTLMDGRGYGLNAIDNPVISLNTEGGVAIEDPAACGENGTIHLNITGVEDGTYNLAYQGGTFQDVVVTGGKADVSAPAGVYNNITIGSGNCQSADGVNATLNAFPCTTDDDVTIERGTATGNVLDNDGDGNGNTTGFTVTKVTIGGNDYPVDPTNGTDIELTGKGSLHINPDGSYSFEPDPNFSGALDEITYTVDNGHGTTNTGKLQIQINSTLPVSGVQDFDVVRKGQIVVLSWSTATEMQNKGFKVERSVDGKSWQSIGFKNSLANQGNSTSQLQYAWEDTHPLQQRAFYRLVQVDHNGRELVVSGIKSLNGILKSFSVYPNPASDYITIQNASGAIYIYDVSGRVVLTQGLQSGVTQIKLNIQGLSKGIYFVKSGDQTVKFIKK